ncbi:MAG: hypothetical protein R3F14_14175 [Polyangiaceae bacterium]
MPLAARALLRLSFVLTLAAFPGCGAPETDTDTDPVPSEALPKDGLPDTCNPLRAAGACLLPYPSAVFAKEDASSPTGQRLDLTPDLFPVNNEGVPFDPVRLNRKDGFSPGTEIIAYFPDRLDPASLPPLDDPEKSLAAGSATVIVDMESGERVAHFSEVDAQAIKEDDRQTLILRPMQRLAFARRYAVGITKSLKTLAGDTPASPEGWAAVKDGTSPTERGKRASARLPDTLSALEKAGVPADDLLLAWDFVTASEPGATGTLLSMRAQTLAALESETFSYKIDSIEDDFSPHALRRVRGTFQAPRFISQTDLAVPEATLTFDDSGDPVRDGTLEAPFTFLLPRAAEKGPVRLLIFGHGFLGSAEGEMGGSGGSYVQSFLDDKGYAAAGTNWTGLSKYEGIDPDGSSAAALAVRDINHLGWIADRLTQAVVNGMVLARIARTSLAKDPALFVNGAPVIDSSRVDYYGISLGGVMGSVLVAASPDLERGVFNVGAAGWTTLLQRSLNWALFKLIVDGSYADKVDQQVLITILQSYLDPADGLNFAAHYADPLPGGPKKQVLLQIGVGDLSVSNVASASFARTASFPLLDSSPLAVWGLPPTSGPLPSALSIFDTQEVDPPPSGNLSGSVTADNNAHDEVRTLPAVNDQTDHFLRQGEVISTCSGPCDPQ